MRSFAIDHIDDEMELSFRIASQCGMFNLSLFIVVLHVQALAIGFGHSSIPRGHDGFRPTAHSWARWSGLVRIRAKVPEAVPTAFQRSAVRMLSARFARHCPV
jgi:hypothetical protein